MRGWGRVLSTTYTRVKKNCLCEGVLFSNSFLSVGQSITKRKFKKMHTSIPVKNKNEFIKIHCIYHTEVKKTNTQADLFQFRTL